MLPSTLYSPPGSDVIKSDEKEREREREREREGGGEREGES
jgi:hypothetical protein